MPWRHWLIVMLLAASSTEGGESIERGNTSSSAQRIPDVVYIPTPPDVVDARLADDGDPASLQI